jgi:hypothetical protein
VLNFDSPLVRSEGEVQGGGISHFISFEFISFCKMGITVTFGSCKILVAKRQWLTPVILATQEAEIRRITVQSQPGQTVCETLS